MDSNITLGLQEVLPRLHGHPHGPPPPPEAAKPLSVARTYDFNDVVSVTDANGKVAVHGMRANVTMRDANGVPSLDGTAALVGEVNATFALTGLSGEGPGHCMWPTSGKAVRTNADGSVHTLVFGSECGKATLDGKAVTLPEWPAPPMGPHKHGPGCGCHGDAASCGCKDDPASCGCHGDHDAKSCGCHGEHGCQGDHGDKAPAPPPHG